MLLDFWTYSCINCLRTLPTSRHGSRISSGGLTIVGVHSPEFAFERVPDNVRAAVKRLGVRYPVALDNDFATWRAYQISITGPRSTSSTERAPALPPLRARAATRTPNGGFVAAR